jgi:signal transduction histidine kinase/CheY-like chemotaxis protein
MTMDVDDDLRVDLDRAPVPLALFAEEQGLVHVNTAFRRLAGDPRDCELVAALGDVVATVTARFQNAGPADPGPAFANLVRVDDGGLVPIEFGCIRLVHGGRRLVLTTFRRRAAEVAELRTDTAPATSSRSHGGCEDARTGDSFRPIAAGVAHDFNNLLTAILANVDLLSPSLSDPGLQEIRAAAERGAALTRQLVPHARSSARRPQPLDLSTVVAGLRRFLQRVNRAEIDLVFDLAAGLPAVEIDASELERIVSNLVLNARDAIPGRGSIVVTTRLAAEGSVELVVGDDGAGIAPEVRDRLFEPFVTTKAAAGGTGLGLSTVERLTKAAGGRIRVVDRRPRGTAFVITFPPAGTAPILRPGETRAGAENHEAQPGERILLVDDDDGVRTASTAVLSALGYRVRSVTTARAAQHALLFDGRPFTLALVDLALADGSGAALGEALRLQQPGLAILYTSGGAAPREPLGPVLAKPFDAQSLARRVRETIDASRPE